MEQACSMCDVCETSDRITARLTETTVINNEMIGARVGLMTLHAPVVAETVMPGQFVHLRVAKGRDFLLRRPFSVYRVTGETIQILYQVIGRGTSEMALAQKGAKMDFIGPIGRGWEIPKGIKSALIVAGGLGAAPLAMLTDRLSENGVSVSVALGALTADQLYCLDILRRTAKTVVCCTDDGSMGIEGKVTIAANEMLSQGDFDIVYTCGPEIMQQAVAQLARKAAVPCQVSLERLMACGIGACLSCVVATKHGNKRACVDGPVFDADEVLWT